MCIIYYIQSFTVYYTYIYIYIIYIYIYIYIYWVHALKGKPLLPHKSVNLFPINGSLLTTPSKIRSSKRRRRSLWHVGAIRRRRRPGPSPAAICLRHRPSTSSVTGHVRWRMTSASSATRRALSKERVSVTSSSWTWPCHTPKRTSVWTRLMTPW